MNAPDPAALGDWADLPFWQNDWPAICAQLEQMQDILPPAHQRFAALNLTQPEQVRVVILGQDPYPTPGHAHGLAFSVTKNTPLPRSLSNIFKEMAADINAKPQHGDLTHLAQQGVLLLNTALTVPAGQAGAHAKLGWDSLIDQVLTRVAQRPTAFLLWGAKAQARAKHIGAPHLKIETAHPSPLSARRGFFGSRPFSKVNHWLESRGEKAIDWANIHGGCHD